MEKPTTLTAPEGQYIDLEESKIVYKAIERVLPKTWRDYVNLTNLDKKLANLGINFTELSNYDKLILLRDYYNDGYKFDWNYPISKYVLIVILILKFYGLVVHSIINILLFILSQKN